VGGLCQAAVRRALDGMLTASPISNNRMLSIDNARLGSAGRIIGMTPPEELPSRAETRALPGTARDGTAQTGNRSAG
jgi:hypothetical protein